MKIQERVLENVVVVDLNGKLTIGEGDEVLREKINSLMQQGHTNLLLNLGEVPYVDSAGLGEIVRTFTTVKHQGGTLKLVNLTKRIKDLLTITKLLAVFDTYESEAEAVGSFKS
jgi:anti-sigma B factor antagonist